MIEDYIGEQINKKILPGVSLLFAADGKILYERCFGSRAVWPRLEPITADTLYDLASLTKPLITAFLAAYLVERKQWRLDDEARRFLPSLSFQATLEQLLTHSAGCKPWHPFYLYRSQGELEQMAMLFTAPPGRRVVYSDVGYILLRHLLEKVSGSSFRELAVEVIFTPLGLHDTFLRVPERARERCAPTEIGNGYERELAAPEHGEAADRFQWRTELIRGEVHDANSFYAGGSAGNAGLFATARDLGKLVCEFHPATTTLLRSETASMFWQDRTPWDSQRRTIGFQLNSSPGASGGRALPPTAIGHSGFTGTSFWLEAKPRRQWILLSNRVHPRVRRMNFNSVRRKLHRLLKAELGLE